MTFPSRWRRARARLVVLAFASLAAGACGSGSADALKRVQASPDYVEVSPAMGLVVDLRYATLNNFVGEDLYGGFDRAFLHRIAAEKLARAVENLKRVHPGYRFIVFDALRPRSVQEILWEQVRGTPQEKYVADPKQGSIHNFGFAVDLSVVDENGKELDMGTGFDAFTPLAEPRQEQALLAQGKLSPQQVGNRGLLRSAMEDAGFLQLPDEWWHFDALPADEVRARYRIVE